MLNNKRINYKLLNFAILVIIVAIIYNIKGLWVGVITTITNIILPFIVAFAVAYALYPLIKKLQKHGLPKWACLAIAGFTIVGIIVITFALVIPLLYEQIILFLSNISVFIQEISTKYSVNLGVLQNSISDISTNFVKELGATISSGALGFLTASLGVVTSVIIILFASIYFLNDMGKIRNFIKLKLKQYRSQIFDYVKTLDTEITNYFSGMGLNMLYQLVEYTTVYLIIGHPNYLLLGFLSAFSNIIPYFGGFIVNIIALIVASTISVKLTILTLIVCLICPNIDCYIISPRIYGKTNKLHPLVNIFAVFAGGVLWGFWGIIISLPVAIIIITTYKFFQKDINHKIGNIKDKV